MTFTDTKRNIFIGIALIFSAYFVGVHTIQAFASSRVVVTVTNTQDAGAGSLRAAIAEAKPGDTIRFDNSLVGQTIALTSGQLSVDKSLIIEGDSGASIVVSGSNMSSVFSIASNTTVTIRNLIIADGRSFTCGGINNSGSLVLSNVHVKDNKAEIFGGGMCSFGPGVTIEDSMFTNNRADSSFRGNDRGGTNGGAIFASVNSLIIRGTGFEQNFANGGGVSDVYHAHSSESSSPTNAHIEITDSTFDGGILNAPFYQKQASSLVIDNVMVDGGLLMNGGEMVATDLVIRNGEGFSNFSGGSAIIEKSQFANNSRFSGGGISNEGMLQLSESDVVSNTATSKGGGIGNS